MKYFKFLPILLVLFLASNLQAQSTIVLFDDNVPFDGACSQFSLGESLTLVIGSECGPASGPSVAIEYVDVNGGILTIAPEVFSDTTIVLDLVGQYNFFCNTPIDINNRTLEIAACATVSENVVPTIGEWGVIILTLLMMTIGIAVIKNRSWTVQHSNI